MTQLSFPAVSFAVVQNLHGRLQRLDPSSDAAEIAERALSYALSDKRPAQSTAFLEHDVLRDARKAVYRERRLRSEVVQDLGRAVANGGRVGVAGLVDGQSPEQLYLSAEFEQELRRDVAHLAPHALRCLDGLVDGESVPQTAAVLGVSPSSVDRIRRGIRDVATRMRQEVA